jgi:NAD(P)-dependent dehydrogenase (short-subunit alcohol dehydrogenase family)
MRVAITGTSGLADIIKRTLEATPFRGQTIEVTPIRVEDITSNKENCWIYNGHRPCDVLINLAHQDQSKILGITHRAWEREKTKYIINISSRAAKPNISKGYEYASEKAQLNHLADNLSYNSKKRYKMTTINLGLLNDENLPSVKHQDVAGLIYKLITSYPEYEITDVTLQAHANYQSVQSDKETLRDMERFTK